MPDVRARGLLRVAAVLMAAAAAAPLAAAQGCPTTGVLPNGLPVGSLLTHPAFQTRIQNLLKDFLMSAQSNGNYTTPAGKWANHVEQQKALGLGAGPTPECPFNNNGFLFSASRACGGAVSLAGVQGMKVGGLGWGGGWRRWRWVPVRAGAWCGLQGVDGAASPRRRRNETCDRTWSWLLPPPGSPPVAAFRRRCCTRHDGCAPTQPLPLPLSAPPQVALNITGNKTRCFDARVRSPRAFSIGGSITIFPPAVQILSQKALGSAAAMHPASSAFSNSSAYCRALGRRPSLNRAPVTDPALLLLGRHWFGTGKNGTCDPAFSILNHKASDLRHVIAAACETAAELADGPSGETVGATTWHLKLHVSRPCRLPCVFSFFLFFASLPCVCVCALFGGRGVVGSLPHVPRPR
jgi:hypothetical protein